MERKHQVLSCGGDGMPLVKAAFVQAGITTRLFSPTPCRRGGVSPRESCEFYPGIRQNQAGESTPCPAPATGTARMRSPHGAERAMLLRRPEAASSFASSSFPACFKWPDCGVPAVVQAHLHPKRFFPHSFCPVHAAQPRSKQWQRAGSAAHSSGDVLENKKNWSLLVLHTPSGGTGMESAGVTHQHSCFGCTLLDNLPMPQSNHPGKQEHEPAQTQSRGWRRHLPEPRGNCRFPPCSGCRRVKNSLQISVSKCGGREQSAVYQCQGFP